MSTGREFKVLALVLGLVLVLVTTFLRKGERIKGVAFFVALARPRRRPSRAGEVEEGPVLLRPPGRHVPVRDVDRGIPPGLVRRQPVLLRRPVRLGHHAADLEAAGRREGGRRHPVPSQLVRPRPALRLRRRPAEPRHHAQHAGSEGRGPAPAPAPAPAAALPRRLLPEALRASARDRGRRARRSAPSPEKAT